ncbi:MAG: hypothetical protein D8M58_00065 [Calditrichaeota bacterium]|nr:MAG: hypothetical protein DWQ03_07015 [Calditrichota bacterium]MBL1203763.1 hypothetical protein [Calditrichota bacterium]NOG43593.1 hypothetical protein [Calditrichota bacterium]
MNIKKYFIIAILFSFIPLEVISASKREYYISPGIRIGYSFGQDMTFNLKLSLGQYGRNTYDHLEFYNVTYGYKFIFFDDKKKHNENFHYFEAQYGSFPEDEDSVINLFNGGSIGILFNKMNGVNNIGFRSTIYSGMWLFPSLELNLYSLEKIHFDLGVKGVLPIPFDGVSP